MPWINFYADKKIKVPQTDTYQVVVAIEALTIYITSGKFHWLGIVLGKKTMKESLPAKYPAQKFPPVTMQKSFD